MDTAAEPASARPLMFSSVDPEVAAAVAAPVRALELGLLGVPALVSAQAAQAVGALVAVGTVWLGLVLSYLVPQLPPSSALVGVAVGAHAPSLAGRRVAALR